MQVLVAGVCLDKMQTIKTLMYELCMCIKLTSQCVLHSSLHRACARIRMHADMLAAARRFTYVSKHSIGFLPNFAHCWDVYRKPKPRGVDVNFQYWENVVGWLVRAVAFHQTPGPHSRVEFVGSFRREVFFFGILRSSPRQSLNFQFCPCNLEP